MRVSSLGEEEEEVISMAVVAVERTGSWKEYPAFGLFLWEIMANMLRNMHVMIRQER